MKIAELQSKITKAFEVPIGVILATCGGHPELLKRDAVDEELITPVEPETPKETEFPKEVEVPPKEAEESPKEVGEPPKEVGEPPKEAGCSDDEDFNIFDFGESDMNFDDWDDIFNS